MGTLNSFASLFSLDLLSFKGWLREQRLIKSTIALIFLFLFTLLVSFIYFASLEYFKNLSSYELFGQLISSYLLHASILITLWLGLASNTLSYLLNLSSPHPFWLYLVTFPLPPQFPSLYLKLKQFLGSLFWSLLILVPAGLAAFSAFNLSVGFIYRLIFIIFTITVWSSSIGIIISLLFNRIFLHRSSRLTVFISLSIFIFFTIILLRFILPNSLFILREVDAEVFLEGFNKLPLNKTYLPTLFLTRFLFNFDIFTLVNISLVNLSLFILTWLSLSRLIYPSWQKQSLNLISSSHRNKNLTLKLLSSRIYYFLTKDLISIRRQPEDMGYGFFLLSLIISFSYFLGSSFGGRSLGSSFSQSLGILSLGWILFYATAYSLRLIFPLMSRDGNVAWLIFSSPITSLRLLIYKIVTSLIIATPLFLSVGLSWYFLPLNHSSRLSLITISLITCLILNFTHLFLGFLKPQFQHASSPNKASTSLLGFITIFTSLAIIWITTKIYQFQNNSFLTSQLITNLLAISLLFLTGIFFLALRSIKKYRF